MHKAKNIQGIHTQALLELLNNPVLAICEASIRKGHARATHFLMRQGDTVIDEGIDGEETKWEAADFLNHYQQTWWTVEQKIYK
ncbi:hypothetical protein A7P98_08260 [Eikenella sp. NML080894]|uniref:hypothetical protein n=1 Tax=Eikenella TaxID=538 RepID=UPI0007DFD3C7|nr:MULTISPECIES: hypothetical protein [Eikenella]OAM34926.1 hypothetical protein A7P98_08260 [Eikenella sp. NML080894]OAM37234.1 hypothetical protein A7P99_07150 [Eikenella sp. NML120348]OAM45441.1 hypothetical protein A7Q03_05955 [Eikenella sp. NML99-0057]